MIHFHSRFYKLYTSVSFWRLFSRSLRESCSLKIQLPRCKLALISMQLQLKEYICPFQCKLIASSIHVHTTKDHIQYSTGKKSLDISSWCWYRSNNFYSILLFFRVSWWRPVSLLKVARFLIQPQRVPVPQHRNLIPDQHQPIPKVNITASHIHPWERRVMAAILFKVHPARLKIHQHPLGLRIHRLIWMRPVNLLDRFYLSYLIAVLIVCPQEVSPTPPRQGKIISNLYSLHISPPSPHPHTCMPFTFIPPPAPQLAQNIDEEKKQC